MLLKLLELEKLFCNCLALPWLEENLPDCWKYPGVASLTAVLNCLCWSNCCPAATATSTTGSGCCESEIGALYIYTPFNKWINGQIKNIKPRNMGQQYTLSKPSISNSNYFKIRIKPSQNAKSLKEYKYHPPSDSV